MTLVRLNLENPYDLNSAVFTTPKKAVTSNQKTVAYWERRAVALKPAQIDALASALGCSHQEILGVQQPKPRGNGPVGKAKALFDRVSALPRDRQQRILGAVEDMLAAHETRKAG